MGERKPREIVFSLKKSQTKFVEGKHFLPSFLLPMLRSYYILYMYTWYTVVQIQRDLFIQNVPNKKLTA